mmetsp:Transcript_6602/g.8932  ORF Transcript_6602/g.8932 Transcript_6602/m.8932 type:complete len:820 (-) Transcript_6602:256-2715(-)
MNSKSSPPPLEAKAGSKIRSSQSPSKLDESLVSLDDIEVSSIVHSRKKKPENGNSTGEEGSGAGAKTGHGGQSEMVMVSKPTINRQQSRVVVRFPQNFVPGHGVSESGQLPVVPASRPSYSSVQHQYYRKSVHSNGQNSLQSLEEGTDFKELEAAAKKKKKKKKKKPHHRIRGGLKEKKPITDVHEQYQLTMGMMVGMRCSVGREDTMDTKILTLTDFMQVDKYVFPPRGNAGGLNPTPPHNIGETFKFKDYSPKIFAHIRQRFGVDRSNYMLTVAGNQEFLEFISNSKSGQFFFYSHNGQYMIKTMSAEETKFLRRILPHYFQHITQYPNTMLTRFYGMHRVKMRHLNRKVHFVIMESVFNTLKTIHKLYDLKGSTKGRIAKPAEKEAGAPWKDLDLLTNKDKLYLGPDCKEKFMAIIRQDVEFLKQMRIMDYSLLVGIHDRWAENNKDQSTPERAFPKGYVAMSSFDLSPLSPVNRPSLCVRKYTETSEIQEQGEGNASNQSEQDDEEEKEVNAYASVTQKGQHLLNATQSLSDRFDANTLNGELENPPVLRPAEQEKGGWRKLFGLKPKEPSTKLVSVSELIPPPADEAQELPPTGSGEVSRYVSRSNSRNKRKKKGGKERRAVSYMVPEENTADLEYVVEEKSEDEESVGAGTITESEFENSDSEIGSDEEEIPCLPQEFSGTSFGASVAGTNENESPRPLFSPFGFRQGSAGNNPSSLPTIISDGSHFSSESNALRNLRISNRRDHGIYSQKAGEEPGREIYYLGIIDILQQYNMRKSMETVLRGVVSDVKTISAVSPEMYGDRFINFMDDNIE